MIKNLFLLNVFTDALSGMSVLLKYVLVLPAFLVTIVSFLFELVRMIPGVFGTITLVFLPFYVGLFAWKIVRGG